MKDKIKLFLGSEKGMGLVNVLFVLAMLFRGSGIIVAACVIWIIYLAYAMKKASSKAGKIINGIFIAAAALLLGCNLYFMIRFIIGNITYPC